MEKRGKSQVWLVNLESSGLERKANKKYSKQMLTEYAPGQKEAILFPVGYVIKHPDDQGSSWENFDGFEKQSDLVPRPIVSNIELSHLEGELLTVLDAALADKSQREALKSLVRQTLWTHNRRLERKVEEIFKSA